MIRIMTLDAARAAEQSADSLRAHLAPLHRGGIDLLCCQSIVHSRDGRMNISHLFSETLGLTCSCFAAGRQPPGSAPDGEQMVKGVATFTGSGVWVLNSGSFTIGSDDEEEIVQFALIRKRSASVLAFNLQLAASPQAQARQLRDLFAHALLRESYGAVVLCTDRTADLSGKEWQNLTARSSYGLHRKLLGPGSGGGQLCLFTARTGATAVVTVRQAGPGPGPGIAMEFEIQRMGSDKWMRSSFPLSFREQWLGYREHRSFA